MGKLSWKKTPYIGEWKADGYYIEQTGDDPPTMVAHTRTAEGFVDAKVGTFIADDEHETDNRLLKRAKAACEQHRRGQREAEPKAAKLGVATALDWVRGDQRWTAETGQRHTEDDGEDLGPVVYAVEPDSDGQWWSQLYTDPVQDLGPPAASPEAAQALCQQHHDTALVWREANPGLWVATSAVLHPSEDYSCAYDSDADDWQAGHLEQPIDEPNTLERAQEICQEHHRELVMGAPEATPFDELGGPDRELGEWIIGRPPTTEVRAALSLKQAETSEEQEALEIELAREERAFKATRKRIEKEISEIRERQIRLAAEVRHGLSAKVRCWRERDGDDWRYTDESGAELYREPAVTLCGGSKQERLCGDRTAPKAEPEQDEAAPDSVPFAVADRLDGDGPNETPLERTENSEPPASVLDKVLDRAIAKAPPLEWSQFRIVGEKGSKGEPAYRAEVPGGEYRVERGEPTGGAESKGLLRASWTPTGGKPIELPGEHATLKAAQAEAEQHWQSRLLWPGDPECGVLVDATNRYQLMRDNKGDWMAIFTGGLDEKAKELGGGDVDEAKEACQDHFDAGRWTR